MKGFGINGLNSVSKKKTMTKINLGQTYGYEDFITEDERLFIEKWAIENNSKLKKNGAGPYRNFGRLDSLGESPSVIDKLKKKFDIIRYL